MRDKRDRLPLPGGRTRFRSTHQAREFRAATLSERSSTDVTHDQPDRTAGPGRDRTRAAPDAERDRPRLGSGGKTAEAVAEYVQKGDRIYASGRLGYDSWEDQDGQRRQTTEVHANEVVFLDHSGGNNNGRQSEATNPSNPPNPPRRRDARSTSAAWGRFPTHEESGPASYSAPERNLR